MTFSEAFEQWQKDGGFIVLPNDKSAYIKDGMDDRYFQQWRPIEWVRIGNKVYAQKWGYRDRDDYLPDSVKFSIEDILSDDWKVLASLPPNPILESQQEGSEGK